MIRILTPVVIPNVGAYDIGAQVEFGQELEDQLVYSGKAQWIEEATEKVVRDIHVEPGLTDD